MPKNIGPKLFEKKILQHKKYSVIALALQQTLRDQSDLGKIIINKDF